MEQIYLNFSGPYYRKVNLNGSYNDYCYLKTQFEKLTESTPNCPGGVIEGYCSLLSNNTDFSLSKEQFVTFCFLSIPLSIAGAFLNFLIILTLLTTPKLRKETMTPFIISLAVTDFTYSAITLPMHISISALEDWPFGEGFCKFFPLLDTTLVACTMWTLLAIAVLRFICVFFPMKTRDEKFNNQRSKVIRKMNKNYSRN